MHEHLDGSITIHYWGEGLLVKVATVETSYLRVRVAEGDHDIIGLSVLAPELDHP